MSLEYLGVILIVLGPAYFRPLVVCVPEQFPCLEVDQLWHSLVQDEVLEFTAFAGLSVDQDEEAQVGREHEHLYSSGYDDEVCLA